MHIATATAPGSGHINPGQPGKTNNQDAIARVEHDQGVVVVLCDGCSGQPHSGTGADIGAHLIVQVILRALSKCKDLSKLDWDHITEEIRQDLRRAVNMFAVDTSIEMFERAVVERFLFTAMVMVTLNDQALVASFGDGFVLIDDEVIDITSPIVNSPPYFGYLLLRNSGYHAKNLRSNLQFRVLRIVTLSQLSWGLVVGTDGLRDLMGEDLHCAALVEPKALQRWLNALTTETFQDGKFIPGKCSDDVSLVIVRTEEAQERLKVDNGVIVGLKQELDSLRSTLEETNQELDEARTSHEEALAKVADLKERIKELKDKAELAELFESELADLGEEAEKFRPMISKRNPVWLLLGKFMKRWDLSREESKPKEEKFRRNRALYNSGGRPSYGGRIIRVEPVDD